MKISNGEFFIGDCLDVMSGFPDGSVDMILCDLPYGYTECDWDDVVDYRSMWQEFNRLIRGDGAMVFTASQPFTTDLITSNRKNFAFAWVWNKRSPGNFFQAKRQPMKVHEDIIVFTKTGKQPNYYPQMTFRSKSHSPGKITRGETAPNRSSPEKIKEHEQKQYTEKYPESIITISIRNKSRGLHPTQKPVKLFQYLIETYSRPGEVVLDATAGSGTTALAAENCDRKWICIERDEKIANDAIERIRQHEAERDLSFVEQLFHVEH